MTEAEAAILAAVARVEQKLDALILALAEEDGEQPERSLDGDLLPGQRDQSQSL